MEDFITKVEWEGGLVGLLDWGGPECFPVELQNAAHRLDGVVKEIKAAMRARDEAVE